MPQNQLNYGVYVFYTGSSDGQQGLYSIHFDGRTMGTPVSYDVPGLPNLIGSPAVFYDRKGQYGGHGTPRIHIFVVDANNTVWWLSTIDGVNIIVHNEGISQISTAFRVSPLLLEDGVHFYYTDLATKRIAHAWSYTDWNVQQNELLLTENETAGWSVDAVYAGAVNILYSNGQQDGNQPQYALQLYYVQPGTGTNQGNGNFISNSPDPSSDIALYGSPSATLLGNNLFIAYKGQGYDAQAGFYATQSMQGEWSGWMPLPDVWTTNSFGTCLYGGRLLCFFQSSQDNNLYLQAFIGGQWLPKAIQVAGNSPAVYWGPAPVAVEHGGAT